MTRLSANQLKKLGLIKPKRKTSVRSISLARWDAKIIPGGIWLQIPFVTPSLNVWTKWCRYKVNEYKRDMYDAVGWLKKGLNLPQYKYATVMVKYYHETNRVRDEVDNWAPKFIMDALVKGGLLVDDRTSWVHVDVDMAVDKEKPRTEVFIWQK